MIKFQGKIPSNPIIAFSGGVDSVAILDFIASRQQCSIAWVDHGDSAAPYEQELVEFYAAKFSLPVFTYKADMSLYTGKASRGKEADWRTERYKFFHSLPREVITCHHLDDCMETYAWFMCQGKIQTIGYRNKNVIRPFRLTSKNELVNWCKNKNLKWFEDPTNADTKFARRNYVRHVLLPQMLMINPGLKKTISKMIRKEEII